MDSSARPSPGLMVTIAFCLAILLGIGGTAAYALWEQGSHSVGSDHPVESAPSTSSRP
ncbi:hypothetical protein NtRootA4_08150 [Arthrobacter sp. NtRootA4]|nr:hypothetical protein NtRootA4_08150 [Arthrobacter sp. NtRootA4]BCW22171.1 hypothetical protein NtRootC7_10380 [Arthrobacter sp. NtRootC7]GGV33189.1 hypothetical protein GCM10010212_21280 [Paenarthrobacter nicotinovorans]